MKTNYEEIKVTLHGSQRLEERIGIEKSNQQEEIALKAWIRGKRPEECLNEMKKYMMKINKDIENCIILYYQGRFWFFSKDGTLITVYPPLSKKINKRLSRGKQYRDSDESDPLDYYSNYIH